MGEERGGRVGVDWPIFPIVLLQEMREGCAGRKGRGLERRCTPLRLIQCCINNVYVYVCVCLYVYMCVDKFSEDVKEAVIAAIK